VGRLSRDLLSLEFGRRCRVRSRARRWLQLVGCAALLLDASNFGGPDGVGESGVEPRSVTTSTDSGFTAMTGASQYLIMPKHMSKELAEPMNINWKTSSIHRFENG